MGARYLGGYPVSKFAVAAYSQQFRYELGELGVHVLLVCPGPMARADAGTRYEPRQQMPESVQAWRGRQGRGIPPDKLAEAAC